MRLLAYLLISFFVVLFGNFFLTWLDITHVDIIRFVFFGRFDIITSCRVIAQVRLAYFYLFAYMFSRFDTGLGIGPVNQHACA